MKKMKISDIDFEALFGRLDEEKDTGCAILGAVILDARLEDLYRTKLVCSKDELLKGMGPLSSFSSRITLGRALNWFDDNIRSDLDTIRDIRNDFAHGFDHKLSFLTQSVDMRCKNLKTASAHLEGYDLALSREGQISNHLVMSMKSSFEPARKRFELTVSFLSQYLEQLKDNKKDSSSQSFYKEVRELSANSKKQFIFKGEASVDKSELKE